MKVLLLGSFGFVGTNIIKYIDENYNGVDIIAFDRFSKHIDHIEFKSVSNVYAGDFSDEHLLDKIFKENKIDLVIHSLSASVPSSSNDNEFDIKFNVLPTIALLNKMVCYGVNDIVFISSGGAIYGDYLSAPSGHTEDETLFPKSAYGVSKLIIEKYLYLYHVQYGLRSLVLRLSNPYGPYHYSQKQGIINIAMEHALENKTFNVWGNGNGKKDYIFIEDFCRLLILLIEKWIDPYCVINIGSGQLKSVNEIVEIVKENVNNSFNWQYKESNVLDVQEFKLNLNRLLTIIPDFRFTDIRDGINRTLDWYKNR